jgi:hypothetical protein
MLNLKKDNKELLKKVREDAIVFAGERADRLAKQKIEDINQNKKIALKEQMKVISFLMTINSDKIKLVCNKIKYLQLEEDVRTRIEKVKEEEKRKATEEIEKFKEIHIENLNPVKERADVKVKPGLLNENQIRDDIFNQNKAIFDDANENNETKKLAQDAQDGKGIE